MGATPSPPPPPPPPVNEQLRPWMDGFSGMQAYHSQLLYISCFCFVKLIVIFYYFIIIMD